MRPRDMAGQGSVEDFIRVIFFGGKEKGNWGPCLPSLIGALCCATRLMFYYGAERVAHPGLSKESAQDMIRERDGRRHSM